MWLRGTRDDWLLVADYAEEIGDALVCQRIREEMERCAPTDGCMCILIEGEQDYEYRIHLDEWEMRNE